MGNSYILSEHSPFLCLIFQPYFCLKCSVLSEVVKLLVGNKVDQERVVLRDVAEEWAKSRGMLFIESSAKTTQGVSQVFNEVVQQVSYHSDFDNQPPPKRDVVKVPTLIDNFFNHWTDT